MPEFDGTVLYPLLSRIDPRDPKSVHNALEEIRRMAGRNIEARLDALEAAQTVRLDALESRLNTFQWVMGVAIVIGGLILRYAP